MNAGSPLGSVVAHQTPTILRLRVSGLTKSLEPTNGFGLSSFRAGVLSDFLKHGQSWSGERVPLPRQLRRSLWALIPLELLWGIWLVTILSGEAPCHGPICTVATLNHHSAVLLACGVICLMGLVGLAVPTRGLSQCNGREVVGLTLAATAGGAALLGIAALIIGALIALIVLGAFVFGFSATS